MAPASKASIACWSKAVTITMTGSGGPLRLRTTSNPLITGICRSRNTTSGGSLVIFCKASLPSPASPTTRTSGKSSNSSRRTRRAIGSSSTIKAFILRGSIWLDVSDIAVGILNKTCDRRIIIDERAELRYGRTIPGNRIPVPEGAELRRRNSLRTNVPMPSIIEYSQMHGFGDCPRGYAVCVFPEGRIPAVTTAPLGARSAIDFAAMANVTALILVPMSGIASGF